MCGIAGLVSLNGAPLDGSSAVIHRMTDILAHRGPDGEGHHIEPHVQLGMRRLSIMDIAGGAQPMKNENGDIWVIFNGEIYNFRKLREELLRDGHSIESWCDTEILVHLYEKHGLDFVQRLKGQFAIALWDRKQQKLVLARDRTGEKPLFYTIAGNILAFASEIKSILCHPAVPRRIDFRGLDQLFTFFMPVNPRTMFEGIQNLPPGHLVEVCNGQVHVHKYWEPPVPDLATLPAASEAEWVGHVRSALRQSVAERMVADVPVGAFLSGGLDSSVIAALAAEISRDRVRTYSICHEDEYYDEGRYSDMVAAKLGTDHHRLVIEPRDIADGLPLTVWRVEAPTCKTSNAAYIQLYKLARGSSTVILTGEGADEALGGYPNVRMMKVLEFCRRHPHLPGANRLMDRLLPPGSSLRVMYYEPRELDPSDHAQVMARFGCIPADLQRFRSLSGLKSRLFSADCRAALADYSAEADFAEHLVNPVLVRGRDPIQQAQYFEYLLKLPNYLLINPGDRAAMTHSVENRCPFLDHEFIELCMKLPLRMRVRALNEKYVLKKAFERDLPQAITKRKKRPFTTFYISSLFRGNRPEYFDDLLSDSAIRNAGLFEYAEVERMKRMLDDPSLSIEKQVQLEIPFALVVTAQLWHQQFIADFDADGAGR
ncbi:MAG: asparagine synthase (glutamine-hydrolyzing) [Gallionellaceae bacterium]